MRQLAVEAGVMKAPPQEAPASAALVRQRKAAQALEMAAQTLAVREQ